MYELRDYQIEATNKGIEFFNSKAKKNSVIVCPTGSGKSLIIANIAKALDGHTIVFQPSKELLEQNYEKYISYGEEAEIYSASMNQKTIGQVTFATIGSVVNKPELFKEFQYCIVDECDLVSPKEGTMYQRFFENLNLKVLGLTATPIRMKRYNFPEPFAMICMLDRMRPRFFSDYIHITQIKELYDRGYFAEIEYFNYDFDNSRLRLNTTGGDYTEKSILLSLEANSTLEKISDLIPKIDCKHILIFVESIGSAHRLQDLIGDSCGLVKATMNKKERETVLSQFKSGKLRCVVNVGILTVGFDFPELDCIISARPTMSLRLYYQIIGRCVRPHPTKTKSSVYDFAGNYGKFGKVSDLMIEKKDNKWIIHNGKNILTNVNVSELQEQTYSEYPILKFGKYSGTPINQVPEKYLIWVYENLDRTKYDNEFIFKYVEENLLIQGAM